MSGSLNLSILIFDDVEVLDFCGPFEVFSVANRDVEPATFSVFTVAESETLEATTHYRCFDQLRQVSPRIRIRTDRRFVDTGRVITSAGISAGIDMSLHIVRRLLGREKARAVAQRMEYDWKHESHDAK